MSDSNPPSTLPDNSIPPPYDGEGEVLGAPVWFQLAIAEIRQERAEMMSALKDTLATVQLRDERMLTMLQTTLDRALENDTRLSRLESQESRNTIAIRHMQAEIQQLKNDRVI